MRDIDKLFAALWSFGVARRSGHLVRGVKSPVLIKRCLRRDRDCRVSNEGGETSLGLELYRHHLRLKILKIRGDRKIDEVQIMGYTPLQRFPFLR